MDLGSFSQRFEKRWRRLIVGSKKIWYRFQLTRVLIAAILAVVLLVSGILTYQAKNGRCREFKSGIGTANGGLR